MRGAALLVPALGGGSAGTLLLLTGPSPASALALLREPGAAGEPTALLVAAVASIAHVLALWLASTVLLTLAGRLPGLTGRACGAVVRCVAPPVVRRAVELVLGLGLAAGAVGASPAVADVPTPAATAVAAPADLDWPTPPTSRPPVLVAPGDTLWGPARQDLVATGTTAPTNAQIAREWPRWWSANRDVVGADPDLVLPGTWLSPP